jgi:putative phosphoesterase
MGLFEADDGTSAVAIGGSAMAANHRRKTIGVISDTHGLLRPAAVAALQDTDLVVHAGDIGSPDVIEALQQLGPVFAVRGNVDRGLWAEGLPATQTVEVQIVRLYVLHDLGALDLDPVAAGFQVVIAGHSHRASITTRQGVQYLNPGSAGPRRFRLPVTVARLSVEPGKVSAEIIVLEP